MSRKLLLGVCFCGLVISQYSCGIFRKGSKKNIQFPSAPVAADSLKIDSAVAINEAKQNLINALVPMWNRQFEFNTFSGKAKLRYESKGQKHDLVAHFRIRKDSVIWATVTAAGGIVQVARVMITPEDFKMINYLEKEVLTMSQKDISKIFPAPVNFSILQNLIIGNVPTTNGNVVDAVETQNMLSLQVETPIMVQFANYEKPDSNLSTLQMRARGDQGPVGLIQYANYSRVNNQKFPMERSVHVINNGETYYLDMGFNKIDIDVPVDFPFSIPKNYKLK